MATPPLHPDVLEYLDDRSLVEAYAEAKAEPLDPMVDRILAEIERRDLNI